MSPLLLHQSCSFCIAQWHWAGERLDWRPQRTTWPPTGARGTLTHTHKLLIVSLSDSRFVWMLLYLSSPTAIQLVNMLSSALTYESTSTIMCNRLLHAPTNWSLPRGLSETLTFRLLSLFCAKKKVLYVFFYTFIHLYIIIHLIWCDVILICKCFFCSQFSSHNRPVGFQFQVSILSVYTWDIHDSRYLCSC